MENQIAIINALKLLKQICEERNECDDCPLRDGDTMPSCQLQNTPPAEWKIKDEKIKWRAFD